MKGAVPEYELLSSNNSLYMHDRGKAHFTPTLSCDKEWKPSKTKIILPAVKEQTFKGKKTIQLKSSDHILGDLIR